MANLIVDRGLQVIGGRTSNTSDSFAAIQSMSIDDSANSFAAGDTSLDASGPVTEVDKDFDATPTRSGQTITHTATFGTDLFNGSTIKRIALHNDVEANVTGSSNTLVAGIDGQSLSKTSDFSISITVDIIYTSA